MVVSILGNKLRAVTLRPLYWGLFLLVSKRQNHLVRSNRQRGRRKHHCCMGEDRAYTVHQYRRVVVFLSSQASPTYNPYLLHRHSHWREKELLFQAWDLDTSGGQCYYSLKGTKLCLFIILFLVSCGWLLGPLGACLIHTLISPLPLLSLSLSLCLKYPSSHWSLDIDLEVVRSFK